jgi:hypothetical protein
MKRSSRSFAWACAALLAGAVTARATVVVDPAGGGDFTTLQAAIDAARDGEQILVKAGSYGQPLDEFVIAGKGLAIMAEAGALVSLPGLRVTALPSDHWVVLRGLTLTSTEPHAPGTLRIDQSAGTVFAEDCTITPAKGYGVGFLGAFVFVAGPGAIIEGGAAGNGTLTLQHCTIAGGEGHNAFQYLQDKITAGAGFPAVDAHNARVVVQNCTLQGGDGGDGEILFFPPFFLPNGGSGLHITGTGLADVSGSHLTGGTNGDMNSYPDDQPGYGLYGEGTSKTWLKDSVVVAGSVVGTGVAVPPINDAYLTFAVTSFPEPSRSIVIPSPLREGQAGSLQIQGQQGDLTLLLVALAPGFQPLSGKHGVLVLDPTLLLLPAALGTITDPGGTQSIPFVMPDLNPTLDGLTIPMQLVVAAGGKATLEAATVVAWLDAGL